MQYCPHCTSPLEEILIDLEIRRGCPDKGCGFVFWNNPTPVVAIIVEVDQGVVLAHNVKWQENFFSVITGFLEAGEDPEACARRETLEELNLYTTESSLVGVYPFERQNQVIIAYHVHAYGEISLNHELDAFKIVPINALQAWDRGTGLAVKDWLKTRQDSKLSAS